MKRLIISMACGMWMFSAFSQANAPSAHDAITQGLKKNQTSILGVQVGMTMEQTLKSLQDRSKRFHVIPKISSDEDSLTLLTDLQVKDARLGWKDGHEMIATTVKVTFYHGKVIKITVFGDSSIFGDSLPAIEGKSIWDAFLRGLPKTSADRRNINGRGTMINAIERCAIGENGNNGEMVVMILWDADNWNEYVDERKKLMSFFNSIPRKDEVFD